MQRNLEYSKIFTLESIHTESVIDTVGSGIQFVSGTRNRINLVIFMTIESRDHELVSGIYESRSGIHESVSGIRLCLGYRAKQYNCLQTSFVINFY